MTSPAQAAQIQLRNASNAQYSTGPRTEAGKAESARNALKHGYYATDALMPGEDAHQFAQLQARVVATWLPADDEERELTDEIAVALWRRRRLRRVEAETWATVRSQGFEPRNLGDALVADSGNGVNAIEKLRRWWQGNERHLNRCMQRLALIQRVALAQAAPPPPEPAQVERPMESLEPPPSRQGSDIVDERTNSQEQTQAGATPTPPAASAHPPGLNRRERRALERHQAKESGRASQSQGQAA